MWLQRDLTDLKRKWAGTQSWALLLIAALGLILTVRSVSNVAEEARRAAAIQNAMMLARSVRTFREVYTDEVVAKSRANEFGISHQEGRSRASFTRTLNRSLDLVNVIGGTDLESRAQLYSPNVFEWSERSGLPDDFARRAWAELSANPGKAVQAFESRDGRMFLRYATSDLMTESCVGCHNNYPGSPRTDWRVGDMRGVLEISLPLDRQLVAADERISSVAGVFMLLSVFFIGISGLSVYSSRKYGRLASHEARRYQDQSEKLRGAITERELAEQETRHLEGQIQHAQKLESFNMMIGGIAHDFNNLLVPIVANSETLRERSGEDAESHLILDEVELAANRAADLCSQMLTYTGKSSLKDHQPLNLNVLLEENGRLLSASLAPNCTLDTDLSRNLPLIEADSVQLSQVVLNLITNASEAIGEEGGTIRIRTGEGDAFFGPTACNSCALRLTRGACEFGSDWCERQKSSGVYFEVYDDGMGMDPETLKKIFDPFFTTKFTGRGLGLAAVQGIVRSHQGAIHIESEPGSHTLIRISFPALGHIPARKRHAEIRPDSSWRHSGGAILLAEDEPTVQMVTKRMLESLGFEVVLANDGDSAVWQFSREPDRFVALLSDLTMPRMDGLRALTAMREIRPDLRAILCSGYSERIEELDKLDDKRTLFLQKPFRSQTLREILERLFEGEAPPKVSNFSLSSERPKSGRSDHVNVAASSSL
jgi:signal transduction histidine kinase/DNA-binding NarL/FixJ family response regulator